MEEDQGFDDESYLAYQQELENRQYLEKNYQEGE